MALIADDENIIRANKEIGSFEVWSEQYDELQRVPISRFSAGKWACQRHDERFPGVDTKQIDLSDPENLFKAFYRTVLRHSHLSLARWHAHCEGIETEEGWKRFKETAFDSPANDDVAEKAQTEWRNQAQAVMWKTMDLEKRLAEKDWNSVEYRTLLLKSKPTVAGWGCLMLKFNLSGLPANDPRQQGYRNYVELAYMVVIPQEDGHAIITACEPVTRFRAPEIVRIHDHIPENADPRKPYQADDDLKRRLSNKIWCLNELGFRESLFQAWSKTERDKVQTWMKERSSSESGHPGQAPGYLPSLI